MNHTETMFAKIDRSISENKNSRVHFRNNRLPMFGKFVKLADADELKAKNFCRFVSAKNFDTFESAGAWKKKELTMLFLVSDFNDIITFVCETLV